MNKNPLFIPFVECHDLIHYWFMVFFLISLCILSVFVLFFGFVVSLQEASDPRIQERLRIWEENKRKGKEADRLTEAARVAKIEKKRLGIEGEPPLSCLHIISTLLPSFSQKVTLPHSLLPHIHLPTSLPYSY